MEALHRRLLAAAGDSPLHLAIVHLLEVPTEPSDEMMTSLWELLDLFQERPVEDLVALNADHETPYEALTQVANAVHGDADIQRRFQAYLMRLGRYATELVWVALRQPYQADANARAIVALRQSGVNALREWAENPRALVTAWNEVGDPALRAALADAILRSAQATLVITAAVVDAVTHQLPPTLAHETAVALVEHHVHVDGVPLLPLTTFLAQRNGAFAMAFHPRLGAASPARHVEAVEELLRQYL